jgi:hypothetical protein
MTLGIAQGSRAHSRTGTGCRAKGPEKLAQKSPRCRSRAGFSVSNTLFEQRFDHTRIAVCRDAFYFLAILEQQNDGPHRGLVAGLESRLRVKIQPEEGEILVGRLLPEFVERQDLALADRSPRGVEVNDDGFATGEQLVEIRLFEDVEFDALGGGGCRRSEKHQQGQSLQDARE